jgi:large subunit ribosomal protein L18
MTATTVKTQRHKRAGRTRHGLKKPAQLNGRLRFNVFRSNSHIYAQIVDDTEGKTLVSASTIDKKLRKEIKQPTSADAAVKVGAEVAKRAKAAGVTDVYFDRGGFRYMGRIKALAEAARENGLKF